MPPGAITENRKRLSLSDKIELLSYYNETKCSIRNLAKHFNIGKTQAGQIIKKQHILFELWLSDSPVNNRKRLSSAGFQIDKLVYDWYLEKKNENREVTGPMLQTKALELSKNLGNDEFKASNGWLARFLKRHGISFKESKDNLGQLKSDEWTDTLSISNFCEWSKGLALILPNYSADNIFSVVQTGLFFKAVPDNTSNLMKKTCFRGTLSAQRFSILLCTSMTGVKEKPFVIADIPKGEVESLKTIEVDCESNSKAWLTQNIMTKWLKEMDNRMVEQKRKIVLFLNHTLPRHDCQLKNIKTVYFPSYLSAENQPINQGIIQNFKIIYRQQLLKYLITVKESDENDSTVDQTISFSQALTWVNSAWKEISEYVIQKCFEELCFNTYVTTDMVSDDDTSATLNDVSDLLCAYDSIVNAAEYVNIDDNLVTEGEDPKSVEILVDDDEIKHIFTDSDEEMATESRNVISNDESNRNVINLYFESLTGLRQLEQFYLSQNDSNGALLVKQLITHHENVINGKNISAQSVQ